MALFPSEMILQQAFVTSFVILSISYVCFKAELMRFDRQIIRDTVRGIPILLLLMIPPFLFWFEYDGTVFLLITTGIICALSWFSKKVFALEYILFQKKNK
jgi:hypothetical protein